MSAATNTTGISAQRAACRACEHAAATPRGLTCTQLGGAVIGTFLVRGRPFCPVGRHDGIAVALVAPATPVPATPRSGWSAWKRRVQFGAAGLLTWLFRLCPAPSAIVTFRRAQCRSCDRRVRWLGFIEACGVCRCVLRAKTAIGSQACPLRRKRWAAIPLPTCRWADTLPIIGRLFRRKGCGGCGRG